MFISFMNRKHPKLIKIFKKHKGMPAICSNCGEKIILPFIPEEGIPVFCDNCCKKMETKKTQSELTEQEKFYKNLNQIFTTLSIMGWIIIIIFLISLFLN